jgi:hypothetical protein
VRRHVSQSAEVLDATRTVGAKSIVDLLSATSCESAPEKPRTLAMVLAQEVKAMCAFDRYEKRALSRRKFVMRTRCCTHGNARGSRY